MTMLVGFKVSRASPLPSRFYCLNCTETLAREKRWDTRAGSRRKGAAPIVASADGAVRYLRVPASNAPTHTNAAHNTDDDPLSYAEGAVLDYLMAGLGLRAVPSIPAPAELDLKCKSCGVGILAAPGQPLSSRALPTPPA